MPSDRELRQRIQQLVDELDNETVLRSELVEARASEAALESELASLRSQLESVTRERDELRDRMERATERSIKCGVCGDYRPDQTVVLCDTCDASGDSARLDVALEILKRYVNRVPRLELLLQESSETIRWYLPRVAKAKELVERIGAEVAGRPTGGEDEQ